jgi:hypothetical protein
MQHIEYYVEAEKLENLYYYIGVGRRLSNIFGEGDSEHLDHLVYLNVYSPFDRIPSLAKLTCQNLPNNYILVLAKIYFFGTKDAILSNQIFIIYARNHQIHRFHIPLSEIPVIFPSAPPSSRAQNFSAFAFSFS